MEVILRMIKEICMFNIFESLFLVLMFLISIKQNLSLGKSIFHIVMLSLLNWFVSNIIITPVIVQLSYIVLMALYFSILFRIKFTKSITINITIYFMLFILEMSLAAVYSYVFHIELISMTNEYTKFLYMLGFRVVEILFIIIYYKLRGGEFCNGKDNKIYR